MSQPDRTLGGAGGEGSHCEARPAIEARGVVKRLGGRNVLDGVDLTVETGRVFVLLGLNGAGKTTLVQVLLGLLTPGAGQVRVLDGRIPDQAARVRQRIGVVSEDLGFYPWMTVSEVIQFAASFHPSWDTRHAGDLASRLQLPLHLRVRELSRGLRCKLALVLAVGHRPELIIMDEPLAGLDPVVRRQVLGQTIDLLAEARRTVLVVTHEISEVEKIADDVGVLHGGRMLVSGDLETVKSRFRRVQATFLAGVPAEAAAIAPGTQLAGELSIVLDAPTEAQEARLRALGATRVESSGLSLEEIFCHLTS